MSGSSSPLLDETQHVISDNSCDDSKRKRKFDFSLRRNIRKLIDDGKINEVTKAAQKAEVERRNRIFNAGLSNANPIVLSDEEDNGSLANELNHTAIQPPVTTEVVELSDDEEENETDDLEWLFSESQNAHNLLHLSRQHKRAIIAECSKDKNHLPDVDGNVLINVGHPKADPDIHLLEHFAKILKPHQICGIKFLYANIIENFASFSSTEGFGCILAHSMGLGKTAQVIGFLEVFFRSIPNAKTALLVVPVNTLSNWENEFETWMPTDPQEPTESTIRHFNVFVLKDSVAKNLKARIQVVANWMNRGGVMIIGYEMFRLLANRPAPKSSSKSEWSVVQAALLNVGPQIVVCDEGHRIKNSDTSISKALKKINTKRRIVLTGYPLQNNLMEYWCMVDFVRPMFLGSKQEFSNTFRRPVENGQCLDSNEDDRKLMQGRAHVLHDLLQGFVLRRSHAVLQLSLAPKFEYVLCVKLSEVQYRLYRAFMTALRRFNSLYVASDGDAFLMNINVLKAYSICFKIWNHPDILFHAIEKSKRSEAFDLEIDDFISSLTEKSSERNEKFSDSENQSLIDSVTFGDSNLRKRRYNDTMLDASTINFPGDLSSKTSSPQSSSISHSTSVPNSLENICYFQTNSTVQKTSKPSTEDGRPPMAVPSNRFMNSKKLDQDPIGQNSPVSYNWAKRPECWNTELDNNVPEFASNDDDENFASNYQRCLLEHSGKFCLLFDLLERCIAANEKMLVFSQSLVTLNTLELFLQSYSSAQLTWRNGETYFRLDGSTLTADRERFIRMFNQPDHPSRLFLLSTRAGCLGINLVGANRVVMMDASWNPCHDCQAVCRVYRYGQTKPCHIYRLIADDCMERKIYDRQVTKQNMANRVVDEHNPANHFTRNQVEQLFTFTEVRRPPVTETELSDFLEQCPDQLLADCLNKNRQWITQIPFTHESLLIDHHDVKLSKKEKQYAKERYEIEKRLQRCYQRNSSTDMRSFVPLNYNNTKTTDPFFQPNVAAMNFMNSNTSHQRNIRPVLYFPHDQNQPIYVDGPTPKLRPPHSFSCHQLNSFNNVQMLHNPYQPNMPPPMSMPSLPVLRELGGTDCVEERNGNEAVAEPLFFETPEVIDLTGGDSPNPAAQDFIASPVRMPDQNNGVSPFQFPPGRIDVDEMRDKGVRVTVMKTSKELKLPMLSPGSGIRQTVVAAGETVEILQTMRSRFLRIPKTGGVIALRQQIDEFQESIGIREGSVKES